MTKKTQENSARILPFRKKVKIESERDVSEVTRDLFTETWRSYLDQPTMAAIKLDKVSVPNEEEEFPVNWPKLTIV